MANIYLNFICPLCDYHNYSAMGYQPAGTVTLSWNSGQPSPAQDKSIQFSCGSCGKVYYFDLKLEGPT